MSRRYAPYIIGLALATAGCSQEDVVSPEARETLQSGAVIQQLGIYLSPHEENLVELRDQDGSDLQLTFAANNDRQVPSSSRTFDSEDPWFFAWDDSDQLWLYTEQDGVITFSRETTTNVGAGGGWEGIPDPFLERLPEQCRTVYQNWSTAKAE